MRALSLILIIGGICWGSLSGIAAERSSVPNSRALYHEIALAGTIDYACSRPATRVQPWGGHEQGPSYGDCFTESFTEKRLLVIDLKLKKILFISYVAHGRNSGEKYATSFSNREGSFKSSLGFLQNGKHVLREERVFFGVGRFGAGN